MLARSIASFAIAAGKTIVSLANFGLPPPGRRHIRRTQWSHMLEHGKPGWCAARDRH